MTGPNTSHGPHAGRLGLLTHERVLAALSAARHGEIVSLNLELDRPGPLNRPRMQRAVRLHNQLRPLEGHEPGNYYVVNDDGVEIALQGSSHLDAFAHFGLLENDGSGRVYHGGHGLEETYPQARAKHLGIDAFQPGIVARGVLVDLVRSLGHQDEGFVPPERHVTRAEVEAALRASGLELGSGDALLCHTGFQALLRRHDGAFPGRCAGLAADTVPLLVESGVALVASDNMGVEPFPTDYSIHIGAMRDHGVVMGELWALESLAERCAALGRHEFLLVSVPLNIPGAFGSPANAVAVL